MKKKILVFLVFGLPAFALYAAQTPIINSFIPVSGAPGTLVTITGSGLESPASITIGGKAAIVISNTGTQLVGMVMPGAVTGVVSVSTTGGFVNSTSNFTVTATSYPGIQEGNKLVGVGNTSNSPQGASVSVSADGNTAIVGDNGDNNYQGAAWIYTRTGTIWTQQGNKLVGTGAVGSANQGVAVALSADGNTAIIGGYSDNFSQGAAWVFTRIMGIWTQESKLVGTGAAVSAGQGISVSLSADGNTAIVGGSKDNLDKGAVWVYTRSNSTWTQQGPKLVGSGAVGAANQGISVSLSADGSTAIVGGYADNNSQGAAWIYTRNGDTWTQQGNKLVATNAIGNAAQGVSVSLSAEGNTAIVGGYQDDSFKGAAWIYTRNAGLWIQEGKLAGTGLIGAAGQGRSVSISADGNTAIMGGYMDNSSQGAIWVFTRSGFTWVQQGIKLNSTGMQQGFSVSLSAEGTTAIANSDHGSAWPFTATAGAPLVGSIQPSIMSFIPTNAGAGNTVTLTGSNFTGATTVNFGDVAASSFNVVSATSITAVVGAGASGSVSVTTPGGTGTLGGFTFVQPSTTPVITSFLPSSGPIASTVTVTGVNFNPVASSNIVFFGATRATVVAATPNALTLIVPSGATYAGITVLNTSTGLTAYSSRFFLPTFTPNKDSITYSDVAAKIDFATGSNPYSVAIGDIDGDGKSDLAIANFGSNTVSVMRNTSSLGLVSFAVKADFSTGSFPYSVAIGDLNADGKQDLAIANSGSNTVSVLLNTSSSGSISFAPKVDFTTGSVPYFVAIGDIDGDGKPDLAVANDGSNTVSILQNTRGTGIISFAPRVDLATGSNPTSLAIGDINGDGKPDLAVANRYSNSISVIRNTGNSGNISFAPRMDLAVGSTPYSVVIGDIDGDGRPDLAATNVNSATVSVMLNTGSLGGISFAPKMDFITGIYPHVAAISDINGDGKPDLTLANAGSNSVSVLRNTGSLGSVSFALKVDFTTGPFPYSVAIGDLNGDGKSDIAIANTGNGTVSILRYNPDAAPTVITTMPSAIASTSAFLSGNINNEGGIAITERGVVYSTSLNPTTSDTKVIVGSGAGIFSQGVTGLISLTTYHVRAYAIRSDGTFYGNDLAFTTNTLSANLSAFTLSAGTLSPVFDSNTTSYTASVPSSTTSITVTPTIVDYTATIKINGTIVTTGIPSGSIPLNVGANTLTVLVTAPDGILTQTYTVAITREASQLITIASFSPSIATVGSTIIITGNNFNTTPSSNIVFFGATRATVSAATTTSLTVTVPSGATYSPISVTNLANNLTGRSLKPFTPTTVFAGTQSFETKRDYAAGSQPYSIDAGDLDGDGRSDLVVTNSGSSTISIYRNLSQDSLLFSAKSDLATGGSPQKVIFYDLDGDGKKDIITGNLSGQSISIFKNTSVSGAITFNPKIDMITGASAQALAVGDLDGDGKPEIVVGYSATQISVYRNSTTAGNISFSTKTDLTIGLQAKSIAIGDIDGDNVPDLAILASNFTTSTVSVLRNTSSIGNLSFGTKIDFQAGSPPVVSYITIGDLDGDGKFDLLVGSSALTLLRNTSSGGNITMAPKIDIPTGVPYSVAIGDLDGDGKPDLATGNANNINGSVSVLRNKSVPGTLLFQSELFSTGASTSAFSIVMTDLDGDGRAELATANSQGMNANKMSILRNFDLIIPPPPVITALSASSGIAGTSIEITGIRFNSNAALNIVKFGAVRAEVTAATDSSLIVNVPSGATYSPVSVLNSATGLAGYSSKYFSISYLPSKSTFIASDLAPAVGFDTGTNPYDVTISDFDNDGKTDIAVPNLSFNTVSFFRNISSPGGITNASFIVKTDFATGTTPNAITASDLNGDGKTDIITSNSNGASLSILRNTFSPASLLSSYFAPKIDVPSGGSTSAVTAGDLNMDGKPDLVFLNGGVPSVHILTNKVQNGIITSSSFSTKISLVTGSSPNAIAVGDLDGDGKPELAVTNGTSNTVSVFYNITIPGNASLPSFAAKVDLPTGLFPSSVVIADLNADGKPELIVGNMSGNSISVFRNISVSGLITNTSFTVKEDFILNFSPKSLAISDINGDGKPDLSAILSNNTGTILRNTSDSEGAPISFAPRLNFFAGMLADALTGGDLDGDGKPDIVIAIQNGISVIRNDINTRPVVFTGAPQSAGISTASITGNANDNGLTTKVSFEYSLSPDMRDSIRVPASIDSIAAGSGFKPVSVQLTGLISGKNYYYRIRGENASGAVYGGVRDFTTLTELIIIPKPVISYVQNAYKFPTGIAIPSLNSSNSGGAVPPADYLRSSTVAGNGVSGYANGISQNAIFNAPTGMVTDSQGNLFISDQLNNRIRKIVLATGEVSTLAGSGLPQFADGAGISASFNLPAGITIDEAGNLYVADLGNHRIRKIVSATGEVTTLAGSIFGYQDGIGTTAKFNGPWGLSTDRAGNLYVADQDNHRIRKIVIATGSVSTVAGGVAGFTNGFATGARFNYPTSIIPDMEGNAFVTDLNNQRIRKINLVTKAVSTLAGDGTAAFADGIGSMAKFNTPYDIAADGRGNLYVADQDNHRIRKIVIASGEVSTLAGNGTVGFADSTGTYAVFNSPNGITYDGVGNLYVSDNGNNRIRKISLNGYTISPTLPQGLSFNGKTGLISGIPLAQTPVTKYLITAYNAGGADTVTITIGIIPPSTNANLSSLTLNNGTISPAFLPETLAYTAAVSNETVSIRIIPTVDDPTATVKVNGFSVTSGIASENVLLAVGNNTVSIVVTAQDSTTIKAYTLTVKRAASSNADLSILTLNPGTLSPVFVSGTTSYTASVPYATSSVTVSPIKSEVNASIKVNGIPVNSGTEYTIPLNVGINTINTVVTAQDSLTLKTYILTVTRAASTNADLSALSLSSGILTPAFTSGIFAYTTSVPSTATSTTVSPVTSDINATIKINGNTVASGSASGNIMLLEGANTITAIVTAPDSITKKTYTLTVNRAVSTDEKDKKDKKDKNKDLTNADLASLSISSSTLSPTFKSKTTIYTATVTSEITSVTVTPILDYVSAVVRVNGIVVINGSSSASIALLKGSNTINIIVTSSDGSTIKTYIVMVTRGINMLPSTKADKSALAAFIPGSGFNNVQNSESVPDDVKTLNPTNILSPNGDGKNDTWMIRNLDMYPNNMVKIYDRNGKEVYSKKNYNNDWDGTFQGSKLGEGTYYYHVDFGTSHTQLKGFISIVH